MANKTAEQVMLDLRRPFAPSDIKWRVQQAGISKSSKPYMILIPYVNARAIQARLDDVMGIGNWKNEFMPIDGGFLCGLSLRIDGEWITKWDGAQRTNIEAIKGGISDAQKRAAVEWGIGRYLYDLESSFAECWIVESRNDAVHIHKYKDKRSNTSYMFGYNLPDLPAWAIPQPDTTPFIEAMQECKTLEDLAAAFKSAYLYSKTNNDTTAESEFVKVKDQCKKKIIDNADKIAAEQLEAIKPDVDKQIKMLGQMPNKTTLDNSYNLACKAITEQCNGKTFDKQIPLNALKEAYEKLTKKLETKTKK